MFNAPTNNMYLNQLQDLETRLNQLKALSVPQQNNNFNTPALPVNPPSNQQIQSVSGYAGAKSYYLPASSSVVLMENDKPFFFIKATDANGVETIKKYRFEEVEIDELQTNNSPDYVSKEDFNALSDQVKTLLSRLNNGSNNNNKK